MDCTDPKSTKRPTPVASSPQSRLHNVNQSLGDRMIAIKSEDLTILAAAHFPISRKGRLQSGLKNQP